MCAVSFYCKGTTLRYPDHPISSFTWLSFGLPKFSGHVCIDADINTVLFILCFVPGGTSFLRNSVVIS